MKNRKIISLSIFLIGLITGLTIAGNLHFKQNSWVQNLNPSTAIAETTDNFTDAVERVANTVGPAVVTIRTEKTERYRIRRSYYGSAFDDEIFDKFFEQFFGTAPEQEYKRYGLGSGVIINEQGYLMTNEHVIENTDKLVVVLPDGREFKGTLKGTDPRSDLAVIKIDGTNLPWAKLGSSDNLRIGQWVVAIGNPFGNLMPNPEPTVTAGVISALHRALPQISQRDSDYNDLIQTDAAINPGNSGGPLVNLNGEVIGINVALFSTTGGYQGIGFAIPINTAKRIVTNLVEGKEVDYGWIGVSVQNINPQLAKYFGLTNNTGVVVIQVLDDSPAQKAGMKGGDVIVSIDGKVITNPSSLIHTVGNLSPGKTVSFGIVRNTKNITIQTIIAKQPSLNESGEIIASKSQGSVSASQQWRGITAENIPTEVAKRLGRDSEEGVLVTNIAQGSPAQESGLRKGDIILSVNYQPIRHIVDFQNMIKSSDGDCLIQTVRGYIILKAPH